MYIVQIASECAPAAKVGGLGDVIFGLSRELQVRGNYVEVILPKYDCMRYDHIWGLTKVFPDLWVPWNRAAIHCSVWYGEVHGLRCFFIEPHSQENFFNRGDFYGYLDEAKRFTFFSKAALEFLLKSNRRPEVIHCHDWQTGIVPVLLYEMYKFAGMWNQRVCYTIHNFKHQGCTGQDVLWATGLNRPEYFLHYDRLRDGFNPNAVNLMKGGIVYSNYVTTVSPQHAWESCCDNQGFGLGHTLQIHQAKFEGVLNGIDYDVWNPEIDPYIPARYNIETLQEKYRDKEALRDRLLLRKSVKPIIAYVGRLDTQKGLHLVRHALFYCLNTDSAQFVLLGSSPEPAINAYFWQIKNQLNDNQDSHLEIGYSEELSHLIYAGADMLIMPSMFEPCGLPQMIGLKYGTVPIVRAVGGLVDTVFDRDYSDKPPEERNGYVFHQTDNDAVESALRRAIGLWYSYPDEFRQVMINGMRHDHSWKGAGEKYLSIYEHIRHK